MNVKKTKYMAITKKLNIQSNKLTRSTNTERVQKYKHLRTWITENNDPTTEIRIIENNRVFQEFHNRTK